MTQATHTPGPWKVNGYMVRTDCKISLFVANCCYGATDAIEANARLIAAAPELLAALEWAVETADTEQYEADWYAAARAAIAKAKGG